MGTDSKDKFIRRDFPESGKVCFRSRTPPPIPEAAKRPSVSPPPLSRHASSPPLPPSSREEEPEEDTNPGMFSQEQAGLLKTLMSFYPEETQRLRTNGNAKPMLQHHLKKHKDELIQEIEGNTKLFFRIPIKYVAIAATALALAAGGVALHSCSEAKGLQQQLQETKQKLRKMEQKLESQKPEKTSSVPRCLRNPPQKPHQKILLKRRPLRRNA